MLVGQANMHKRTDCAAALANHIYLQMRDMKVTSPGNSHDRCQLFQPNPRREGLPKTVTEWRANRLNQKRGDKGQPSTSNDIVHDESEEEFITAYDIMKSGESENLDNPPIEEVLGTDLIVVKGSLAINK